MKRFTIMALVCALISIISFLESQAQTRLYVPGQAVDDTQNGFDDGVGIHYDEPEARLHIYENKDKATALRVDLNQAYMPGPGTSIATPAFAFEVYSSKYNHTSFYRYLSIDLEGRLRVGLNDDLYLNSDQLSVNRTFGVYRDDEEYLRIEYKYQPKFTWKSSKDFKFINEYSGTEPLTFSPDGKVGINTDHFVGSHSLYIEGSVISEEIFVKLKADWADYVFASDYELMPLKELEAYINRNQRLPGMKSAEEIAEEGVAVGETERKLTEKVEELTLYIIEMNKKIEALEAKLAEAEEN